MASRRWLREHTSNLARAGVDDRIIDHSMGHQTEEMRRRYQHLFHENACPGGSAAANDGQQRDPVVILPSVPGLKADTHHTGGTRGSLTFPKGPYAQEVQRAAGVPRYASVLLIAASFRPHCPGQLR